jgi:hypothetical protein
VSPAAGLATLSCLKRDKPPSFFSPLSFSLGKHEVESNEIRSSKMVPSLSKRMMITIMMVLKKKKKKKR